MFSSVQFSSVQFSSPDLTQSVKSQPFWVGPRVFSGTTHGLLHSCWQCFAVYPQIFLPLPFPHLCLTVHTVSICQLLSIPLTVPVWWCLVVVAHRVAWHHPHRARISSLFHQPFMACSEAHLLMTRTGQWEIFSVIVNLTWSCTNFSLQTFEGNNDRNSEVKHVLYKVLARYLRFQPKTHHGHVCMRTEVFGVKIKPGDGMIKNIITCSVCCVIVEHAYQEVRVWTQIVSLWFFKVTPNLCGATFAKHCLFNKRCELLSDLFMANGLIQSCYIKLYFQFYCSFYVWT